MAAPLMAFFYPRLVDFSRSEDQMHRYKPDPFLGTDRVLFRRRSWRGETGIHLDPAKKE